LILFKIFNFSRDRAFFISKNDENYKEQQKNSAARALVRRHAARAGSDETLGLRQLLCDMRQYGKF
jgi:5-formaminoimidazole-4-carboxamide-1-beta-D-ribofuranosyl 5'-monophosphate synthetase